MKLLSSYRFGTVVPLVMLHLGLAALFFVRFRWAWFWLAVGLYLIRMFGITAGYHRYFSHRTYRLNRVNQFLMAFLAETSGEKGILWWAAHHRLHHRHADRTPDIHSPGLSGFWWAHAGWILSNRYDGYDPRLVADFGKYPELRWLDRHYVVPPALLGAAVLVIGGMGAFVWGFVLSTVVLLHATFTINSLAHIWGSRRFSTSDDSRNNFFLALLTLGEGWHNNHHRFMYACRQGIRWWEIDITYYLLLLLGKLGVARELKGIRPSELEEATRG